MWYADTHLLQPAHESAAIIYCHYNADGMCLPYVFRQLKALQDLFSNRIFVSNSPITETCKSKVKTLGFEVIIRENKGYDFGAWKEGYYNLRTIKNIECFYFMNDSCLGPLPEFRKCVETLLKSHADLVALSSNQQIVHHLQTIFFGFQNRAVADGFCDRFWHAVEDLADKTEIIRRYEIGLTQNAKKAGLSLFALYEGPWLNFLSRCSLILRLLKSLNYKTVLKHFLYLILQPKINPFQLDQKTGFPSKIPLIKKEIITRNPFDLNVPEFLTHLHKKCPKTAQDAAKFIQMRAHNNV